MATILRDKLTNRYGLTRHEGIEYACSCFASGTDEKGNQKIMAERWQHEKDCSVFNPKIWTENQKPCDCPNGSTINSDGSLTIQPYEHGTACEIRRKSNRESVEINPFYGGYI
jgi:hypothetical protein